MMDNMSRYEYSDLQLDSVKNVTCLRLSYVEPDKESYKKCFVQVF
jgi:hypothetical protein